MLYHQLAILNEMEGNEFASADTDTDVILATNHRPLFSTIETCCQLLAHSSADILMIERQQRNLDLLPPQLYSLQPINSTAYSQDSSSFLRTSIIIPCLPDTPTSSLESAAWHRQQSSRPRPLACQYADGLRGRHSARLDAMLRPAESLTAIVWEPCYCTYGLFRNVSRAYRIPEVAEVCWSLAVLPTHAVRYFGDFAGHYTFANEASLWV